MVRFCCMPNCSNRSDRESHLSYYSLPLKKKALLKRWIHVIRRKKLPLTINTRVCSQHFVRAEGRRLYPDEVPSLLLPSMPVSKSRNPPKDRSCNEILAEEVHGDEDDGLRAAKDAFAQTAPVDDKEILLAEEKVKVANLEKQLMEEKMKAEKQKFKLSSMEDDDAKILFYTGFSSYSLLKGFYLYLGPAVYDLKY